MPARAVAKKSTTKRPDSITDRTQEEQQQTYQGNIEKIQQPQGHIEVCQCIGFFLSHLKVEIDGSCFVVKKLYNAATTGVSAV